MTDVLSRAFPPPVNWQDFENLSFDLYSRLWKTNDAEMHGRRGRPQAGVDIYGTDRVEKVFVGVQCKGKDEGYGASLTVGELRREVDKAKTFEPSLDVFILATTALNDAEVQKVARELSRRHAAEGLFEVRVQGWSTLKQRITDYPELLQKYFSDYAPYDLVARFDQSDIRIREEGAKTHARIG
jgi:cellulose synthase operon protein C